MIPLAGGMAEWLKAAVLKTVDRKVRGFESLSLRQPISGSDLALGFVARSRRGDKQNTEPTMLLEEPFNELQATFSPDGRWIAYTSDESGRFEVYVRSFPELRDRNQISTDGGMEPLWNRDGTELFYRNGDKMMSVTTALAPELVLGRPELLFEAPYEGLRRLTATNYDVAEDGRFLMLQSEEDRANSTLRINVVLNRFEELKAHVPTEK